MVHTLSQKLALGRSRTTGPAPSKKETMPAPRRGNAWRTLFVTHPHCAGHRISHHPEQPKRVEAIETAVLAHLGEHVAHDSRPPDATREALGRFHTKKHIAKLEGLFTRVEEAAAAPVFDPAARVPRRTMLSIDEDTAVMPRSRAAALSAAGGACRAVDAVLGTEQYHSAFACVRPPGHHATPSQAMGFCLFNNVGIAALHARATHGVQRVAVVDVDVHHGNGTEAFFRDDPDLFYASFHQAGDDFYPGTGLAPGAKAGFKRGRELSVNGAKVAGETGVAHNVVNCPLGRGAGLRVIRRAMEEKILPALKAFAPGLVIISLGFDALARDPIGGLNLDPHDYAYLTRAIASAAPAAKLVSVLEGGYDVREIARGAVAHVAELARLAKGKTEDPGHRRPRGASVISEISSGESWGSGQSDSDDDVNTLVANMSLDSVAGLHQTSPQASMSLESMIPERPATPPPPLPVPPRRSPRGVSPGVLPVEYGTDGSPLRRSPRVSTASPAQPPPAMPQIE